MGSHFFGHYGDRIQFVDHADLKRKLAEIDCSVPCGTEGRKPHHREQSCFRQYLLKLAQDNLLTFPVTCIKREHPDFLITEGSDQTRGVEQTEATINAYQQAWTALEKDEEAIALEPDLFKGREPDSHGGYEAALLYPGSRLSGDGWVGLDVEKEWTRVIIHAVKKKTDRLNREPYFPAERQELLAHADVPGTGLMVNQALPILKGKLEELLADPEYLKTFDCITVIGGDYFLYDVGGNPRILH